MSDTVDDVSNASVPLRSGNASPVNFPGKSEPSSGYVSSSPPSPTSPQSISPPHTLKRSKSSSFRLINRRISTVSNGSQLSLPSEPEDRLASFIGWYPAFLLRIYCEIFGMFAFVFIKELPFMLPTLWFSACLWLFCKSVMLPFAVVKAMLIFLFVPASERRRRKRTVLISGGSTVQALYLARNFYSAGARVVVCDIEGSFPLARFSTAVNRFYSIPQPADDKIQEYIDALKNIVLGEQASYYIPVSEASAAYYDALAKPHIELLGCECICPDMREVVFLDDLSEVMNKLESDGMVTPQRYIVQTSADLSRLYDTGTVKQEPHFMINVGLSGCKQRIQIDLPRTKRGLKLAANISEHNPWMVVQNSDGERYVTCTTVRESRVVGNVTCRLNDFGMLEPVSNPQIEQWLQHFFANLKNYQNIVGHISFYFTLIPKKGLLLPTGCHVGVRQPYVCYTSVQSRIVWKPCRHFNRSKSGPIVINNGVYWLNETLTKALTHLTPLRIWNLFGIMRGMHDALFVLWDPLPYCAYYYVQVPLNNLKKLWIRYTGREFFSWW